MSAGVPLMWFESHFTKRQITARLLRRCFVEKFLTPVRKAVKYQIYRTILCDCFQPPGHLGSFRWFFGNKYIFVIAAPEPQ
jgi:hypothetical protein